MCACIMNNQIITHVNLWQLSVNCKFVIIFTKRTCNIVYMVARCIFFSRYRNMMVCTVHCRTHKVYRTRIDTDVFLVCMLFMNCFCNKAAVRCKHETSEFRINCNIAHAIWCQHFIINLVNAFTDNSNIIFFLIRLVCNADTA